MYVRLCYVKGFKISKPKIAPKRAKHRLTKINSIT